MAMACYLHARGRHAIYLTDRVVESLKAATAAHPVGARLREPADGGPWNDIKKVSACEERAHRQLWFHDLRRSFVTNAGGWAARVGVDEMSGHRTPRSFDSTTSSTRTTCASGGTPAGDAARW